MGDTSGEETDFPAGALGVTPSGARIFRFLVFGFYFFEFTGFKWGWGNLVFSYLCSVLNSPDLSGVEIAWSLVISVVF
jgi:hypothetical protein